MLFLRRLYLTQVTQIFAARDSGVIKNLLSEKLLCVYLFELFIPFLWMGPVMFCPFGSSVRNPWQWSIRPNFPGGKVRHGIDKMNSLGLTHCAGVAVTRQTLTWMLGNHGRNPVSHCCYLFAQDCVGEVQHSVFILL